MINFYGGPKGENYVVSHNFGNTWELRQDLELGGASPVDLGEIVMISYGLPGTDEYNTNLEYDYGSDIIENFYFTYNPYLQYYPSTDHHFGTNGHNQLYTILDARYSAGTKYNGIKNMMKEGQQHCQKCQDNRGWKVWVKFNLTGTIRFNGNFITNVSDSDREEYSKDPMIEWYLGTSIEEVQKGRHQGQAIFKKSDENNAIILDSNSNDIITTITNENNQKEYELKIPINADTSIQCYAILAVYPKTAINFTTLRIDRSETQFNFLNFNSCLYQKVLKNTLNETQDSLIHIVSNNSNFAYKFLTSSLGSTPIINFNRDAQFTDSDKAPEVIKNLNFSTLRHQVFNLKFPYPSNIKEGIDEETGLEYLQLKYQEDGAEETHNFYFPTLSVAEEDGAFKVIVKNNNNNSTNETAITVVPEFKVDENGNISWRIKDTGSYQNLGNIQGPVGPSQGPTIIKNISYNDNDHEYSNPFSILQLAAIGYNLAGKEITGQDEIAIVMLTHNYKEEEEKITKNYIFVYSFCSDNSYNESTSFNATSGVIVNPRQDNLLHRTYYSSLEVNGGNSQVKYISSTDNQSLILNTSENYDPTDKIFGAEGLTAGETNKIGTKVFDIVGYEGTEGGEGYYILGCDSEQQVAIMLTDINAAIEEQKNKSQNLKWSIKAGFCYDYAGNIIKAEEMKDEDILEISQEFQDFAFGVGENRVDTSFYNPINNMDYTPLLNSNDLGTIIFNDELNEKIDSIEIKPIDDAYKYTWTTPNFIIVYQIGNITISKRNVDSNFNELTKITIQMNLQSNENTKKLIKLIVNNFYSNAVSKGIKTEYLPNKFNIGDRFGRYDCAPLGYYMEHRTNEGSTEATEGILYICGYPKIGTRELFGRSYSFGSNNISQQAFSFQSGYGNQGYNKMGITIGQENISGYGNAVFGRWNDIGFAQMNISQGDYNKIGNYAKYDAQFGLKLKSDYDHQYQFGRYNKNKENNIIEVGYGSNEINRKNIFEVDKEGKIYSNEMENMIDQKFNMNLNTSNINLSEINISIPENKNTVTPTINAPCCYFPSLDAIKSNMELNKKYLMIIDIKVISEKNNLSIDFRDQVNSLDRGYAIINTPGSYTLYTILDNTQLITNYQLYVRTSSKDNIEYSIQYNNCVLYEIAELNTMVPNKILENENNKLEIIFKDSDYYSILQQHQKPHLIIWDNKQYVLPKEATENYEIINTYIPSEFTKYNSQKWENILKINEINNNISISCPRLSAEQDVIISFNPREGIGLEEYKAQKEVYDLIISNSYAKTFDDEVVIYILDSEIIDINNETECPILIKVV